MYSTCLFCRAALGSNQTLEQFQVGRRVAFDSARGRLWVICPRCARWNLSPIEERWEVQEACEAAFREAPLRSSTGEIGLARLGDGVELIRIGKPQPPEMMSWRYGRMIHGGRRKLPVLQLGLLAVGASFMVVPPATVAFGAFAVGAYAIGHGYALFDRMLRPLVQVPVGEGGLVGVTSVQIWQARLRRDRSDWGLEIRARMGYGRIAPGKPVTLTLRGETAVAASAAILPHINPAFARRTTIDAALSFLDGTPGVDEGFRAATRVAGVKADGSRALMKLPAPVLLGLEIATHQELERRAMEGELNRLQEAWREAEGIAEIADRLLVPDSIEEKIVRFRQGGTDPVDR